MGAPKGNKYGIGNNGGRPPVYTSAKKLANAVDEYFDYILGEGLEVEEDMPIKEGKNTVIKKIKVFKWIRRPEPATITGLALFLGFSDRQSLYDYQAKEEYSCVIKKARTRVEMEYEKTLHAEGSPGAIFALKNMGWSDKQEVTTKNINYNTDLTPDEIRKYDKELEKEY